MPCGAVTNRRGSLRRTLILFCLPWGVSSSGSRGPCVWFPWTWLPSVLLAFLVGVEAVGSGTMSGAPESVGITTTGGRLLRICLIFELSCVGSCSIMSSIFSGIWLGAIEGRRLGIRLGAAGGMRLDGIWDGTAEGTTVVLRGFFTVSKYSSSIGMGVEGFRFRLMGLRLG